MLKELPPLQMVSPQNPAPGRAGASKKNGIGLNRPRELMERLHLVSALDVQLATGQGRTARPDKVAEQNPLSLEKPTFAGSHRNERGAPIAGFHRQSG
jgi:hypothetical protein